MPDLREKLVALTKVDIPLDEYTCVTRDDHSTFADYRRWWSEARELNHLSTRRLVTFYSLPRVWITLIWRERNSKK